tara:strand:- start:934 stop:1491 length:558 start_codon:yes stop_codon:yes gene_type:complete
MKINILTLTLSILLSFNIAYTQTYKVDLEKSKLEWKSVKITGEHYGEVKIQSGFVEIENGKIIGGNFIIDMKGMSVVDTDDEEKQKDIIDDISGKTFFNVKEFPTAKFEITKYYNGFLYGDLTIKGITVSIQFKTQFKIGNKSFIAKTIPFTIDRRKWKLKLSNWIKESAVDNELEFNVYIQAIK